MNSSVCVTIDSISFRSASKRVRSSSSSSSSARSRMRVSGVFRSCDNAVRMRVRSWMKVARRCCIVLKAREACCTSRGPSSGSAGRSRSWPRPSAASVRRCRGRTTQRTATYDRASTLSSSTPSDSTSRHGNACGAAGSAVSKAAQRPSRNCTSVRNTACPAPAPIMPGPPPCMRPCGDASLPAMPGMPAIGAKPSRGCTRTSRSSPSAARRRVANIAACQPAAASARTRGASANDSTSGGTRSTATTCARSASPSASSSLTTSAMRCAGCMPKLPATSRSRSAALIAALSSCATNRPPASTSTSRPNNERGSQRCSQPCSPGGQVCTGKALISRPCPPAPPTRSPRRARS